MGRKNLIYSFKMLDAVPDDTNTYSAEVDCSQMDQASIIIEWDAGGNVGEIFVEARNGDAAGPRQANFQQVDMGGSIALTSSDTSHLLVFNQMPWTTLRLRYVTNSGLGGSVWATITAKQVGG